ncbi:tyrosine-type recombinase/integrase [Gordonia sp. NPDC003424]
MAGQRSFGSIRKLPSKRFQARYVGPDMARHTAYTTYSAKIDAEAWLSDERRLIERGEWTPPASRAAAKAAGGVTVREFATAWLATKDLTPKTRHLYQTLLDGRILPHLGDQRMVDVDLETVRAWWKDREADDTPTTSAHAYNLLKGIFNAAVADENLAVTANPCRVEKAGRRPKRVDLELLTPSELVQATAKLHEHYRTCVPVTAWCGLRFGEMIELRRKDVVVSKDGTMVLKIRRAATIVGKDLVEGKPKSEAGVRDITVPPHVAKALTAHMKRFTEPGPEALVFTTIRGTRLTAGTFTKPFKAAVASVGKPDVRIHDLRHVGAVLAAQAGATTKELMGRLGHSTPEMSMRYQHVAAGRDAEIARRLSELAEEN